MNSSQPTDGQVPAKLKINLSRDIESVLPGIISVDVAEAYSARLTKEEAIRRAIHYAIKYGVNVTKIFVQARANIAWQYPGGEMEELDIVSMLSSAAAEAKPGHGRSITIFDRDSIESILVECDFWEPRLGQSVSHDAFVAFCLQLRSSVLCKVLDKQRDATQAKFGYIIESRFRPFGPRK